MGRLLTDLRENKTVSYFSLTHRLAPGYICDLPKLFSWAFIKIAHGATTLLCRQINFHPHYVLAHWPNKNLINDCVLSLLLHRGVYNILRDTRDKMYFFHLKN